MGGINALFARPRWQVLCFGLWSGVLVLIALHVLLRHLLSSGSTIPVQMLWRLFDVNEEANVPTWYSTILWLGAAASSFHIALHQESQPGSRAKYWLSLSALFVFLSLDEAAQLHEMIGDILAIWQPLSGPLSYEWVVYGIVFAGSVSAIYFRFVLCLPLQVRRSIILAAIVYVAGALGFEMLSAADFASSISSPALRRLLTFIPWEEFLEMTGTVLLLYGLLAYMNDRQLPLMIGFMLHPGLRCRRL